MAADRGFMAEIREALTPLGASFCNDGAAYKRGTVHSAVNQLRKRGYEITYDRETQCYTTMALPPDAGERPSVDAPAPMKTRSYPRLGEELRVVMLAEERGAVYLTLLDSSKRNRWYVELHEA